MSEPLSSSTRRQGTPGCGERRRRQLQTNRSDSDGGGVGGGAGRLGQGQAPRGGGGNRQRLRDLPVRPRVAQEYRRPRERGPEAKSCLLKV